MKVFVDVGDISNMLVRFIASGEYKTILDALNGDTKEDGFKGALYIVPSLILANCDGVSVTHDKK